MGAGDRISKPNASPVVMRRKPPALPKTGETVAVSVRSSIAFPASGAVTSSTFGHGPKFGSVNLQIWKNSTSSLGWKP
jgi:hypothetical protein